MGFFSKLKEGLTKTRDNIVSGIDSVFSGFSSIDDDFYDELEETLIMGGTFRRIRRSINYVRCWNGYIIRNNFKFKR